MKNWIELCSDVNWEEYHGMWCKKASDGSYWILRWTNLWDAIGEDECKRDGHPKYECQVKRLDLSELDKKDLESALQCHCLTLTDEGIVSGQGELMDPKYEDLIKVECCIQYGYGAPMETFTGNHHPIHVRGKARKYAENMMKDDSGTRKRLKRSVNAIGTSAENYGKGIFLMKREQPKTVNEAVKILRKWSEKATIDHQYQYLVGMIDALECFGDMPCPQALLDSWDFTREL